MATGRNGVDFGAMNQQGEHYTLYGNTAVFAGGSLTGKDVMHALADGLNMAWEIEVYLQTGKLEYPKRGKPSDVVADLSKLHKSEPVTPTDNGIFTDEEAAAEAERCIRCQCDACRTTCDLSAFTNK